MSATSYDRMTPAQRWDPQQRADYLKAIGADSPRLRESRDLAYRTGCWQPGDERTPSYAPGEDVIRRDVLDVEASYRTQRLVRRTQTINVRCACGGAASMPPAVADGEYVCEDCWRSERAERLDRESTAALATRSAVADLTELLGPYGQR